MADVYVRPAPTAQDYRFDLWLAAALFVAGVISSALISVIGFYSDGQLGMEWGIATAAIGCGSLALRRRYPITVAAIVCTVYFVAVTFKVPELHVGNIVMFVALFTVGAWVNDRRRALIARVAIIAAMAVWLFVTMYVAVTADPDVGYSRVGAFSPFVAYTLLNLMINAGFFGGAFLLGNRAWKSALEKERLRQRTRDLESEREVTAAQAVALDRLGIARELHDVVAHHVSAMGVQAAAARLMLDRNRNAAALALGEIESSARGAIDELHHLLETLRSPGNVPHAVEAASTLRLEHLDDLVARVNEVGMPTTMTVLGTPTPVTEVIQVNLYRIAQEALTNARRHGGPDVTADVRLRYDPEFIEVEVSNTGRTPLQSRPGLGQLGMRERVTASGGTIELTPRLRGGFLVRATIPLPKGVA